MTRSSSSQWAHLFEGKDSKDILEVPPPTDMSQRIAFRFAQTDAYRAFERAEAEKLSAERRRMVGLIASRAGLGNEGEGETAAAVAKPIDAPSARMFPREVPLVIPQGKSDELLERQIASCAGIIDHLARYIARSDTDPQVCANFIDRIASLMNSSAGVGTTIGRLRGLGPEENVHRMIYQREGGVGAPRQ